MIQRISPAAVLVIRGMTPDGRRADHVHISVFALCELEVNSLGGSEEAPRREKAAE